MPIALLEKEDDYVSAYGKIRRTTSLTFANAGNLIDIIREIKAIPPTFAPKYPLENCKELYGDSKAKNVECPYCHTTNVKKITNTSKAVHTALFGIFSVSRNSKQWHYNNCNSDF